MIYHILKLILLNFLLSVILLAGEDTWFKFEDEQQKLVGYKDANGKVMIKPQFSNALVNTHQKKFDDILVVDGYYMLKSGKKFANGKVYYTSEGMHACESEGYIKFRGEQRLVGLFDKNANVVVPAEYNYLSNVYNGLLYGKKGAKKVIVGREHHRFEGGMVYLLNTENELLIENFKPSSKIDYSSLKILKEPSTNEVRDNFLGTNGKYYSFVNYKKEFNFWFHNIFLKQNNKKEIASHLYNKMLYDGNNNREDMNKEKFIFKYYKQFNHTFNRLKDTNTKWKIFQEHYYYNVSKYKKLSYIFDNCGDEITEKYPLFDVYINYMVKGVEHQDAVSFLRTKNGYKMIHAMIYDHVIAHW